MPAKRKPIAPNRCRHQWSTGRRQGSPPGLHECARSKAHHGRCECFCGATSTTKGKQ